MLNWRPSERGFPLRKFPQSHSLEDLRPRLGSQNPSGWGGTADGAQGVRRMGNYESRAAVFQQPFLRPFDQQQVPGRASDVLLPVHLGVLGIVLLIIEVGV